MSRENTPSGKYPAVAVPMAGPDDGTQIIRFGEASTGTAQAIVYFKIIRGERAGDILPWFGSMTKDSYERTMQSLRYAGWKGSDITKPGNLDQEVEIEVEESEYQGKVRSKIAWVNPPGGGAFKLERPIQGQALATLSARIRQHASRIGEFDGPRVDRNAPIVRAPAGDGGDGETRVERDNPNDDRPVDDWGGGGQQTRGGGSAAPRGGNGGGRSSGRESWGDTRQDPRGNDWGSGGGAPASGGAAGPDDDIPF